MLSKELRKDAARSFKEQKPSAGIYAVRSKESRNVWVGATRNLDSTKNSCWFQLRNGLHQVKSLQQEWDELGEPTFEYEILDRLDAEVHAFEVNDRLKEKRARWVAQLKAQQLL